jgi:hypothetical protein
MHEIRACVVDLVTRHVTLPSGGRVLANLRDGAGLPVSGAELELVYEAPRDRTVNLFDVSDGGSFEVAFVSKVSGDGSTEDARYHVASLRDSTWRTEDVAPAGSIFGYIHAGFYVGGIAFPHDTPGGRALVSREQDGVWYLERWDRADGGAWSAAPAVFEPSATRIVRPWPVRNPPAGLDVVALALERSDDNYTETLSHLVGGAAS